MTFLYLIPINVFSHLALNSTNKKIRFMEMNNKLNADQNLKYITAVTSYMVHVNGFHPVGSV